METNGGFEIVNFKKIKNPVKDSNLEPLIYEGFVRRIPFIFPVEIGERSTFDSIVKWDKLGRCRNLDRKDCFIDISKLK
jgi:hypothetical protein